MARAARTATRLCCWYRCDLDALKVAVWFSHEFCGLGYDDSSRDLHLRASEALTRCEQGACSSGVYQVDAASLADLRVIVVLLDAQPGSIRLYDYTDTMLKLHIAQATRHEPDNSV